jgi:hypothetical protein
VLYPDPRPAVRTLLLAVAVTVALWFIPFADLVAYPVRLFVTFIHESGHALAAILTGNAVQGLSVAPDGSGLVYFTSGNRVERMLVASAGYLGAMGYGAGLLLLLRRGIATRAALAGTAALVLALTLRYGFPSPFTLLVGVGLALALLAAARWAGSRLASFLVGFLAVQCVLGALLDLKGLLARSSPLAPAAHTDATLMADITGLPALFWALVWIALALAMLAAVLRAYAGGRRAPRGRALPRRDRLRV